MAYVQEDSPVAALTPVGVVSCGRSLSWQRCSSSGLESVLFAIEEKESCLTSFDLVNSYVSQKSTVVQVFGGGGVTVLL